jgi:peptide chain release factor 1
VFRVVGPGAVALFGNEGGGHRWQRVPPNEHRGRIHTSTVTVAVLPEPSEAELRLNPADLEWDTARGTGPGGQARNKTESAVIVTHHPSGVTVRCDTSRSQHQNRSTALSMLRARLLDAQRLAAVRAENDARRGQVGSGMRGDKIRTIRTQDDTVTDHRTGRHWRYRDYVRGEW